MRAISTFSHVSTSARTISGDIAIPRVKVTGDAAILQKVIDVFRLWRGEWFADVGAGTPWLQRILGVSPPPSGAEAAAILRAQLLAIDGIVSADVQATVDGRNRNLSYSFSAQLVSGGVITGGSGQDFALHAVPS